VTAEAMEAEVRRTGRPVSLVKSLDDLPGAVAEIARPNDLVITLGAGSIGTMPDRILEALGVGDVTPKATAESANGG
jgi:UDP-N-acetylmuramate--alanine ligase